VRLGNTGEGPFEDPECGRPLDLSALRADDALIDALGAGLVRPDVPFEGCAESDRELVALLAAWVAEVRPEGSEPLAHADLQPALTDQRPRQLAAVPDQPATEAASVEPATLRPAMAGHLTPNRSATGSSGPVARPAERQRGLLAQFGRRLAVAALLAGLASTGLAIGIGSEPDGTSVAVSRVAYADRARSAVAAAQVTDELDVARTALEQGHRAEAARAITSIGQHLPAVRDDDGRARLERDHQRLRRILDASGGPPAANDIVLAAVAPEVEPSDFLGNLTDRNDRLGADAPSPAAPAPAAVPAPVPGPNGTGPPAVILAEGPPPATKGPTPAAGSAGSGAGAGGGSPTTTASAPTSTGDPSTGSASTGSSGSESSSADTSVPETSATSARETSAPESSRSESSSPESSSPESSTGGKTSTKETSESSTTRETSDPESNAPETTAVPKPPSSATRTTQPEDESSSASSTRSTSPLPSSRDFIGPVVDRPSEGPSSGATTRGETTSRTASDQTSSRTSTSRTSTSDASQADSDN
jgi:hypothetical protein